MICSQTCTLDYWCAPIKISNKWVANQSKVLLLFILLQEIKQHGSQHLAIAYIKGSTGIFTTLLEIIDDFDSKLCS